MKRVLITGVNSYVGNNLNDWLGNHPEEYTVDLMSLRDGTWKKEDFSIYNSIVHVAGIAHVSTDPKLEEQYYKVNRDLTIEVATKAKIEGVSQFVFLSSIIVYGENIENGGVITRETIPKPSNFYGNSKLQAEKGIETLNDDTFKVAIIRPPMIYGKDSKGNYSRLAKLARKSPAFPNIDNKRSMLHIDNLSEFIKLLIDNKDKGLFFPQNKEYVNTSKMVRLISDIHGRRIVLTRIFNPLLNIARKRRGIINKVFGDLVYAKQMSEYRFDYQIRNLSETIEKTEV